MDGGHRRVLVLPPAPTSTGRLLADAARSRGMDVRMLTRRPIPRELYGRAHLYGGEVFADAVAPELGMALLQPPVGWLATLPRRFTRRKVELTTLAKAYGLAGPIFVKPATSKEFPAWIYASGERLPAGVPAATPVLVAEPTRFLTEYRLYVLEGAVHVGSRYLVEGVLDPAPAEALPEWADVQEFAAELLAHEAEDLPSALVVDVGTVRVGSRLELAVVEANEAWFSNCYAADTARVLDVVLRAAAPAASVLTRDRSFVRP